MGVMPMSALFILFDFVMQNPSHEETRDNMALLDVATGYFSHLEYTSKGVLPGSVFSEFSQIAREFCRQAQLNSNQHNDDTIETSQTARTAVHSEEERRPIIENEGEDNVSCT